jgi:CheY-like chemotaxis protein
MKLNLSNKAILIIEDYPIMRKSLKDMLYALGANYIFEAENGSAAISAMNKQKFDIVLCDYNLGTGKNGQQILEEAKYNKLISFKTIFIIVTAHQTASFVLSAIENKPDEYLAKPFNTQQLCRRIEKSQLRKDAFSVIEKEIDKGNLARAILHCDELLAKNNMALRSQLLKLRANLALNTGDFDKASNIYQEILEHRELAWARLGTGVVAFFQNNFQLAITIFQKLIAQNPMLMECYDWLADSYEALANYAEAEETLKLATEISPHSFSRQKKLALLADRTGHVEVAEQAYLAAIDLGKYSVHKSPSEFSGLAKIYSKNRKNIEALSTLDNMRQLFVNNSEAELRAASIETEVYKDMGNNTLSQQAFQNVHKFNNHLKDRAPKDLQLDVAKACYLNDNDETANNIISSLIHNYIDDNSFIDDIRQMQSDIGKHNYSEILIQKTRQELIRINNQGVALFQKGHTKEAFSVFSQAVEKMPNNKTIILNMAKITIHALKTSGITEEKLLLAHHYIQKAKQADVSVDKLGSLQVEFENITHTPQTLV